MAQLPPNINWLEDAAEKCETGGRLVIPVGDQKYVVRVTKHDPEVHGDPDVLTDGGEQE